MYLVVGIIGMILLIAFIRAIGFSFSPSDIFSSDAHVEFADGEYVFAPITARDHKRGAENASVTWVEYSDFECPYCMRFYSVTHEILDAYPNDVRMVYRHYPNTISHTGAYTKALASECAADQAGDGAFWAFHDALFISEASGISVSTEELGAVAESIGLNAAELASCVQDEIFAFRINEDMLTGANSGIEGTPTSLVIGPDGSVQVVQGVVSLEQASEIIDQLLASYAN